MLLKLSYDGPPSNFAFQFNLRRYIEGLMDLADDAEKGVGSAGFRFLLGGGMVGPRDESKVGALNPSVLYTWPLQSGSTTVFHAPPPPPRSDCLPIQPSKIVTPD